MLKEIGMVGYIHLEVQIDTTDRQYIAWRKVKDRLTRNTTVPKNESLHWHIDTAVQSANHGTLPYRPPR
jgi:adenylate kinase